MSAGVGAGESRADSAPAECVHADYPARIGWGEGMRVAWRCASCGRIGADWAPTRDDGQ